MGKCSGVYFVYTLSVLFGFNKEQLHINMVMSLRQIMPPEIEHSVVDTSYVLNEIRHRYVMVASYTCMGRFKLRNSTNNQLFCKNLVWSSPVWPECIAGKILNDIFCNFSVIIFEYSVF